MNPQPLLFSTHEAEKHGREDEPMNDEVDSKRRGVLSDSSSYNR